MQPLPNCSVFRALTVLANIARRFNCPDFPDPTDRTHHDDVKVSIREEHKK